MRIDYDRRGAGEPLVLIHLLGGDRRAWDPVLGLLASERDVIALDLPGFGSSPALQGEGPPSPHALAMAVSRLLDELGVERPHVAGNSLGGWIALELALAGRARSVTAIAPAGLWPQPLAPRQGRARSVARAALPLLPAVIGIPAARRAALSVAVAQPDRVPAAAAIGLVRSYVSSTGFDAVNAAMRSSRFEGLERIRVPVTLAWPDHDRLVGRPAHLPPRVRNVVLRDCGHMPMWDDPEQVARVLLNGSSQS